MTIMMILTDNYVDADDADAFHVGRLIYPRVRLLLSLTTLGMQSLPQGPSMASPSLDHSQSMLGWLRRSLIITVGRIEGWGVEEERGKERGEGRTE